MAVVVYDWLPGCQPPHKPREEATTATYSRDGPIGPPATPLPLPSHVLCPYIEGYEP